MKKKIDIECRCVTDNIFKIQQPSKEIFFM